MHCWCGHGPWHYHGYPYPPAYPPPGYYSQPEFSGPPPRWATRRRPADADELAEYPRTAFELHYPHVVEWFRRESHDTALQRRRQPRPVRSGGRLRPIDDPHPTR